MCQYEYNISNGQKIVSNINIYIGHYFLHIAYVIFILTQRLVPVGKCNATCFFLPSKINKLNVIHVSKRGNHHPKKYILDYILNISVLTIFITFLQSEKNRLSVSSQISSHRHLFLSMGGPSSSYYYY